MILRAMLKVLVLVFLILIPVYIYIDRTEAIIPTCRTSAYLTKDYNGFKYNRVISISVIRVDNNVAAVIINGEISVPNDSVKLFFNRRAEYKYVYEKNNGHFVLTPKSYDVYNDDDVIDTEYDKLIPDLNKKYYIYIRKLTDSIYVFGNNYSPMFSCFVQ